MAKAYFGIPVTSALVERFFSKTGFILRPHRRCMQVDLEENLFYTKENINFLIDKKNSRVGVAWVTPTSQSIYTSLKYGTSWICTS